MVDQQHPCVGSVVRKSIMILTPLSAQSPTDSQIRYHHWAFMQWRSAELHATLWLSVDLTVWPGPWSWECNNCITSLAPTIAGWTHSPHLHPLTLYPFIVPFVACSHREGLHREHCRAQRSSAGEAEHRLQLGKPFSVEPHCSSSASTGNNDHCASSACFSLQDCCHEQLYTLNHRCGRQCIWPADGGQQSRSGGEGSVTLHPMQCLQSFMICCGRNLQYARMINTRSFIAFSITSFN